MNWVQWGRGVIPSRDKAQWWGGEGGGDAITKKKHLISVTAKIGIN